MDIQAERILGRCDQNACLISLIQMPTIDLFQQAGAGGAQRSQKG